MNEQDFIQLLLKEGFKLWKYSYTIHSSYGGKFNKVVTGYYWSKSTPEPINILGTKSPDKTLSYILEVEYYGQSLEQTIKSP